MSGASNRSTLLRLLGAGTFSEVFCARNNSLARDFALKTRVLPGEAELTRCFAPRLFIDYLPEEKELWLKLGEYSLYEAVQCGKEVDINVLLTGLTDSLATIHAAGYVHGDIKPQNIVFFPWGEWSIIDLGACRPAGSRSGVGPGGWGTPEHIQLQPDIAATDVFGVGLCLYYAAMRKRAFGDGWLGHAHQVAQGVVPERPTCTISDIIMRCLRHNPEHRFPDAAALCCAISERTPVGTT